VCLPGAWGASSDIEDGLLATEKMISMSDISWLCHRCGKPRSVILLLLRVHE
jgi:hypothetical protein